jgi:hypothetical protein
MHLQSATPRNHQGKLQDYFCVNSMELLCSMCIRGTHATPEIELQDDLLQEDEGVVDS